MTQTVKAVEHTDIRGKKQKYITIGEANKLVIINVGQKTFDAVKALEAAQTIKDIKIKK